MPKILTKHYFMQSKYSNNVRMWLYIQGLCHSSFRYDYILLKHLNVTLELILLLDSSHIVSQWLWFIWSHNKNSYECMLFHFATKITKVYRKLHTSCPHIPSKFDVNWTRSGHGAKDLRVQSSKYHCFDCFSRVRK